MNKILVVYWSGTGNTEKMAKLIGEGITSSNFEAIVKSVSEVTASVIKDYNTIVLGCSSMGSEQLEDEMDSFVSDIEHNIADKKVALFGSYGWGDGEWMRDWETRIKNCGATLIGNEGLIVMEEPNGSTADGCIEFGKTIAKA